MIRSATIVLTLCALTVASCRLPSAGPRDGLVTWVPVDSLNRTLPAAVRVFAGTNDRRPLRAWYVSVDLNRPEVGARIGVSDDTDLRETTSQLAADEGACVAVNGGYFRMDLDPTRHVGLLKAGGRLVEPSTASILRGDLRYPTIRAALGFTNGGQAHVAWATTRNDSTFAWPAPPANRPGSPATPPDYTRARPWPVRDALAAGPLLLDDGAVRVSANEEVFFTTSEPERHPRTAAGVTRDGRLILMVVDGRQPYSHGATFTELARLLASTGAVDGLNLDGGGSSTLIVNGRLVNRPSGTPIEREVMSAVLVDCRQP